MHMDLKSEVDSQGKNTWPEIVLRNALHMHISTRLDFG